MPNTSSMKVLAEGLIQSSASMSEIGQQCALGTAQAAPAVSTLVPSGADDVSLNAAALFSAQGTQAGEVCAQSVNYLMNAAAPLNQVAAQYMDSDEAGADSMSFF